MYVIKTNDPYEVMTYEADKSGDNVLTSIRLKEESCSPQAEHTTFSIRNI